MLEAKFLKKEVVQKLGIPQRTLHFWIQRGLVTPDFPTARGRGIPMTFSKRNLVEIRMVQILQEKCLLPLETIAVILQGLRKYRNVPEDFFSNPEWGEEREYLFYQETPPHGPRAFSPAYKNKYGQFDFSFDAAIKQGRVFIIVTLGKVKNQALSSLGF